MSFREFTIAEEMLPPRDRHIVLGDLTKMIHPDFHPRIWALINELERGAWEGGASEGYDHGMHDMAYSLGVNT